MLLVMVSLLIERAYEWRRRYEPRALPRDLSVPAVPPRISGNPAAYFGPDVYPAEAARRGWEGRSSVAVIVDPAGVPTACEVTQSSGHAILDRTTCRMAMEHVRFRPALDRRGRPVSGIYHGFNVRWQLPSDAK
ncbi:energy transducer TonB [Sphingomonas sp. GM_Shp_1]|uniref:energy transducer TonB n=1 Tax=Sphingomonas sp. GM_Shp_1 TaxID=2937381 RepID=UPI00226B6BAB|nr:energy transducer TonB [Sphingomonas sp. GM_Shp_1]